MEKIIRYLEFINFTFLVLSIPVFAIDDVFEPFNEETEGFWNTMENPSHYFVADGRYVFRGDKKGEGIVYYVIWYGGINPTASPDRSNSNYFENFIVSTNATWEGGDELEYFGLNINCSNKNQLRFVIKGTGNYYAIDILNSITKSSQLLVDWTNISFITTGHSNNLSITKIGNDYRFYINERLVKRLTITDCFGGGLGLVASQQVDTAFDNFKITNLGLIGKATFSPIDNVLYLPAVEVPGAFNTTQVFKADLQLIPLTDPYQFKAITVERLQ